MSAIYGYLGATADSLAILWLGALLTLLVVSVRRTGAELLPVSGGGGH